MSNYDDYDQPRERRRRDDRPPYPQYDDDREDRRRPPRGEAGGSQVGKQGTDIPPPPLGSAMKREGSRSRVPNLKPGFPDEASYLSGRSPDLERKNGDRDRKFREKRDGYNSDEGETLREPRKTRSRRERPPYDEDGPSYRPTASEAGSSMPIRERRDRGHKSEGEDNYDKRRPRDDDRRRRDYEDRPRRRRDDAYYDDDETLPPRRRGPRDGVEYGAEPIKTSRRDDEPRRSDRDRRRRYDDDEEDERARRRKSVPASRRNDKYDDDDYYDKEPRRRRDDYDDRDRRPARRRSYDDDDDYYRKGRRDDRDRRDRRDDKRKEPTHMKIGKTDIGPAIDKGQKYYASLAPILTPIVMNYLKGKK